MRFAPWGKRRPDGRSGVGEALAAGLVTLGGLWLVSVGGAAMRTGELVFEGGARSGPLSGWGAVVMGTVIAVSGAFWLRSCLRGPEGLSRDEIERITREHEAGKRKRRR